MLGHARRALFVRAENGRGHREDDSARWDDCEGGGQRAAARHAGGGPGM